MTLVAWFERFAMPIGLEALDDLLDLALVIDDDGLVPRLSQVLRRPVQRLDERGLLVDYHRFLVRQVEGGVGISDRDVRSRTAPKAWTGSPLVRAH